MEENKKADLGQLIVEYAVNKGLNVRNGYSGRRMFGKSCLGIVGSMPELEALLNNVKGANEGLCKDNMGLNYIYYWPFIDKGPNFSKETKKLTADLRN